jgi:DeoR/GlpR family transcriptional regulator of sugar metabolism
MFLARELKNIKDITVITNSAQIVTELAKNQDIHVISTGGILVPNSISFVGPHANSMVNNYFADKFFASCKGISARYGATDSSDLEIEVKENMVNRSSEVIILADYSKFKERGLSSFAEINKINKIISDSSTPQSVRDEFLEKGLKIE